jgi:hypothetical protein
MTYTMRRTGLSNCQTDWIFRWNGIDEIRITKGVARYASDRGIHTAGGGVPAILKNHLWPVVTTRRSAPRLPPRAPRTAANVSPRRTSHNRMSAST